MTTLIAYANIHTHFPFDDVPFIPERLQQSAVSPIENPRIKQRFQCRRLAHFLLWQLLQTQEKNFPKNTALLQQIRRTNSGRPEFLSSPMDFNISHSGDWVAVMLSQPLTIQKSAVGIDIEVPKNRRFADLLAHFAPDSEIAWWQNQKNPEQAFYRIWCLRETVLKSQGVGIVKLSEVQHLANELQIYSAHCPTGKLMFTAELPFYLSAFANEPVADFQLYQWNGKNLQPTPLIEPIYYAVNP